MPVRKYIPRTFPPVEAIQYTVDTRDELLAFCTTGEGAISVTRRGIDNDGAEFERAFPILHLETGDVILRANHWVIKVNGTFLVMSNGAFRQFFSMSPEEKT